MTDDQWFSNKDLYIQIQGLQANIAELNAAMKETAVLIRDYNGLRQKVNDCEQLLHESQGRTAGGQAIYGYIVGGVGLIIALISFAVK